VQQGILMKGIGYFTLAKWEINVGKGYPYTVRKPVFVIDEKLAKDYNLKRKRAYNTGKVITIFISLYFQDNFNLITYYYYRYMNDISICYQ